MAHHPPSAPLAVGTARRVPPSSVRMLERRRTGAVGLVPVVTLAVVTALSTPAQGKHTARQPLVSQVRTCTPYAKPIDAIGPRVCHA